MRILENMEWNYLWLTLALVAAVLLLTGPGLWSARWGWTFLERFERKRKPTR
jgi:hypothetical protein